MFSLLVNSIPRCFHASSSSHERDEVLTVVRSRKPKTKIPVLVFKRSDLISFANEEEEAEVCSICLEEFTEGERIAVLPRCKHMYHKECIGEWLERSTQCPMCRVRVIKKRVTKKSSNGDGNSRDMMISTGRNVQAWSHLYAMYC